MTALRHPARAPFGLKLTASASAFGALALAGCQAGADARDDAGLINAQLLKLLTSDGRSICVDGKTVGEPLAIFRTMLPAPDPARRPLGWHVPSPLDIGPSLRVGRLANQELRGERIVLPEREQTKDFLPAVEQVQLNGLAREASVMTPDSGVGVENTPEAPRAAVRWWPLNRLRSGCGPIYTVSKPVTFRGHGFVTVTAGHRGTTYVFRKTGDAWAPYAKWSTWLY